MREQPPRQGLAKRKARKSAQRQGDVLAPVGGKGTLLGLIEGVIVMGVLTNGLGVQGVDSYTQLVFKGVVLILVVGIDSFEQNRAKKARMKIKAAEESTSQTK